MTSYRVKGGCHSMTPSKQRALIIVSFALLAVFAVAGWTRQPVISAANSGVNQSLVDGPAQTLQPNGIAAPATTVAYAPAYTTPYPQGQQFVPASAAPATFAPNAIASTSFDTRGTGEAVST